MFKGSITEFTVDWKNCSPEERQTRTDPGCPGTIAINITEVQLELKNKEDLNSVSVGKTVEFSISECFEISDGENDGSHWGEGIGRGEIVSIDIWDYQGSIMVDIELEDGYAEDL